MLLLYCREWLQGLWQWLSTHRTDLPVLVDCGWPILPVKGNKLVPLQPLSSSAVLISSSELWPAGLSEVLTGSLGCHVLDCDSFELPVEQLLQMSVHRSGGAGVAAAVSCSGVLEDTRQLQLSAAEARLISGFLLQEKWFATAAADTTVS